VERSVQSLGLDGPAWRQLAEWQQAMGDRLAAALLAPLPAMEPAWRLGISHLTRLGWYGLRTPAAWAQRYFQTEAARRIIPGLALHVDLGPNDLTGAGLGLVLALLAAGPGFRVPVGGARAITQALIRRLEEHGGKMQLNSHVNGILVRDRKVVAVRTGEPGCVSVRSGDEIPVRHAILADVGAPALFLKLLDQRWISGWLQRSMRKFRYGWGTFKMDWALSGSVPWSAPEARASAVVHAGDSIADLINFTQEVRAGQLPSNPYLVIGQQSLVDPTRVPPSPLGAEGPGIRETGAQTLWAYSHVPSQVDAGWDQHRESFADLIEERIEGLAPGFRDLIRARAIHSPADLETMDENLVGGDLGGGSARLTQQLFFRPAFPYFRYRTPVRGLYLASASTHPGAGVHGACGFNAAQMAIRDRK
jgi:phytoene dehydrogenase-like protein